MIDSGRNFATMDSGEVLDVLRSSEYGLSLEQAVRRLAEYGRNDLPDATPEGWFSIFFRQFKSPLIFILLIAGVVVAFMGDRVDAGVIFFVLVFNATVGAIQEGRAQSTFRALKKFVEGRAFVLRDRQETVIADTEIVPGDIIVLREGEKVPADARLLSTQSLQVNEAAFTGESLPKHKSEAVMDREGVGFSDQNNIVFKGTTVTMGSGRAVVFATGNETAVGGIARETLGVDTEFPLKGDVRTLSHFVIFSVSVVSATLFLLGALSGYALPDLFKVVVAVAVSVIPEGLPIVLTLVLAHGVWRMGKRQVLVKKLQAIEVLGETSILAVDKTGTVTKNELSVVEVLVGSRRFSIEGGGYSPDGGALFEGKRAYPSDFPELELAGRMAALGTSANLLFSAESNRWDIAGDPTEGALLVFSRRMGFDRDELAHRMERVGELPFDYERKIHRVLVRDGSKCLLVVTGSPEVVLELSDRSFATEGLTRLSSQKREHWKHIFRKLSRKGQRVIGFAYSETSEDYLDPETVPPLVFGGLFGIQDTIREEVRHAVQRVEEAGMRVVMITGDAVLSARAIAEEAGIYREGDRVIDGDMIDAMEDDVLAKTVSSVSIFARVTPAHKLKIIQAYRSNGKVVAMTGDGVNDALSLSAADIGVAMGGIGTEVAKEASDVVLLDDNFSSIVNGVEEGRTIFFTIKRVILYLFSTSLGEVMVIVGALLLGYPIPLLAAQILWLNLITDGFLDISLALERHTLEKKAFVKTALVDRSMIYRMVFMAIPMAVGTLFLFSRYIDNDLMKAWTVSLTTLAAFQWFNAWNCRSKNRSIFMLGVFSNPFLVGATVLVIGLQVLALSVPALQGVLRTVPLSLGEWGLIVAVASSVFFLEEARKLVAHMRRRFRSVEYDTRWQS